MKHLIIIAGLIIMMPAAHTQVVTNFRRVAEQFYARGDYYSAAQYYEKYLSGKTPPHSGYNAYVVQKQGTGSVSHGQLGGLDVDLLYRMGECYFHLNDFIHAEQWYKLLLNKDTATYPQARYAYGVCLRSNGNISGALREFERFIQANPVADKTTKRAQQEIDNCLFLTDQIKNPIPGVDIDKMNSNINSKECANYAAGWVNNSTIAFTSTRAEGANNALYTAALTPAGFWGRAEKINLALPKSIQLGTPALTPDGKRMFFTGWVVNNKTGKKYSAIYMSEKDGERWSQPVLIDGNPDQQTFNSRQPQVTADGKYLLFSSDRSDGIGGFDVWYAALDEKGRPGEVMNLGPAINTTADEATPFYHQATKTLVFASNGRTGMGGFDLYYSAGTFDGSWGVALNMGYPVNSEKDDLYFIGRGKNLLEDAMVSSDRSSLCCLELFSIHKKYNQVFSGEVVDCETKQPLEGATVTAIDPRGQTVAEMKTGSNGKYAITVDAGLALQIGSKLKDYQEALLTASPSKFDTIYTGSLCMTKKPDPFKGKGKEVAYLIAFEFKTEIAQVSYPYLDLMVAYLKANPLVELEIDVHTDGDGSVKSNLYLSQGRANAVAEYIVKAGIAPDRLMPKGFGECCPVEKETFPDGKPNPAAKEKNRRVVFKIVN